MNVLYNIEELESTLVGVLKNASLDVDAIYEGQRPSNEDESLNDFLVVNVPSAIRDQATYANTVVRIEIFVKNLKKGLKNSKRFQLIFNDLCAIFPIHTEQYVFDSNPTIIPLGNDKYGYHVQAIQIQTLLKSV